MPIYEYRCRGCGDDFEKYVHGPSTKVACPMCQSGDITRKLSVFGLKSDGNFMPSPTGGGGGCCGGGGCGCHERRRDRLRVPRKARQGPSMSQDLRRLE